MLSPPTTHRQVFEPYCRQPSPSPLWILWDCSSPVLFRRPEDLKRWFQLLHLTNWVDYQSHIKLSYFGNGLGAVCHRNLHLVSVAVCPRSWQVSHTHRDLHTVLPLKRRDVLVPPRHLRTVQRPETTHHLDGALRRVRHVHRRGRVERLQLHQSRQLRAADSPGPWDSCSRCVRTAPD